MRFAILALALAAAACDSGMTVNGVPVSGEGGGYTLEVRSDHGDESYVVTAPDGQRVGGQVVNGASSLMNTQALAAMPAPPAASQGGPNDVSINVPGFSLHASGDDKGDGDDHGRVNIRTGGVSIDAEGNTEKGDERAHVVIGGVSADDAAKFINDAEHLSPEVKQQMIATLHLEDHGAAAHE